MSGSQGLHATGLIGRQAVSGPETMIAAIERDARETAGQTGRTSIAPAVLEAVRTVRRDAFVAEGAKLAAWLNRPLQIGHGQTISQPFIVALMTDLLDLRPGDRVLEIGTGSGYQAAVLARLVREVFSVEIVPELAERAQGTLLAEGFANVQVRIGHGALGWPEQAPFDAVIVTAAAPAIPQPLIDQLKPGGRMILPIGRPDADQTLLMLTKDAAGQVSRRAVLPVSFVPLTGSSDFPRAGGPA